MIWLGAGMLSGGVLIYLFILGMAKASYKEDHTKDDEYRETVRARASDEGSTHRKESR